MIVNSFEERYEIVYQRAHALLAAKAISLWQSSRPELDWVELLNATAQHDHGWVETESKHLVEDGAPLHFLSVALDDALELSEEAVDRAFIQSNNCGILVCRHVEYLYGSREEREVRDAVRRWRERREERMERYDVSVEWLERHYEMLLWGDSLSLLLCCEPSPFRDSLQLRLRGHRFSLHTHREAVFCLSPWPFDKTNVELDVEYYSIPRKRYSDDGELLDCLREVGPRRRRFTLTPP